MKKNRYPDAYRSLIRLRHTELQAARDLYYIHVQLHEESKIIRGETYFQRLSELFTIPRVRRATLASFVVMLAQQMCGINSKCLIPSHFALLLIQSSQSLPFTRRLYSSKLATLNASLSTLRLALVL